MFEQEEKMLQNAKIKHQEIVIPAELDAYIRQGIEQGKRAKGARLRKRLSVMAAGFLVLIFFSSIRLSPALAAYLSNVPGLDYIVRLINYDKGLTSAVENNFIQHIGLSDEHDGIVLSVDDMIIDETRMILFYTVKDKSQQRSLDIEAVKFTLPGGTPLKASYSWTRYPEPKNQEIKNYIDVSFNQETTIPAVLKASIKLAEGPKTLDETWTINLPIDKSKFADMKQVYTLNKVVEVEGQRIKFSEVAVYPTRIGVQVEYDSKNTKRIFAFDNLNIVNEEGDVWARISNGISASLIDDSHQILYFESNYFTNPKELYLEGSSLRAVDKTKDFVQIDLDTKTVRGPDQRLTLVSIEPKVNNLELNLRLKVDQELDKKFSYNIFAHSFRDGAGTAYRLLSSGGSTKDASGNQEIFLSIPKANYKGPLTFGLDDYPSRIKGQFRLQIK